MRSETLRRDGMKAGVEAFRTAAAWCVPVAAILAECGSASRGGRLVLFYNGCGSVVASVGVREDMTLLCGWVGKGRGGGLRGG